MTNNMTNNEHQDITSSRNLRLRRRLFMVVPIVVALIAGYLFVFGGRYISTDNAYVKADVVNVSAELSGNIVAVEVVENQPVERGDVLLRLDNAAYLAELHDADAELRQALILIESLQAAYVQKQAALASAQDDLAFAQKQRNRIDDLHRRGVASAQQLDQVQRDLDVAKNTVSRLESEKAETLAKLGGRADADPQLHPEVLAARATLEQAELNLARTVIRAPVAGVASKVPHVGQYAMPGVPMVSVVASDNLWIEANLKEDQLARIRPGARVAVEIDAYPGEEWTAVVDSLAQATGAEFALLPPQNATGNWVKVVQRLPVRLRIEHHEGESILRSGLSADVTVDTGLPERVQRLADTFGVTVGDALPDSTGAMIARHP